MSQLFTLFRHWLARQFTLLGREADADALAMHLLARSQGVATLAKAGSLEDLQVRIADDPFVAARVVEAEILEVSPSRADERLAFLLG